MNILTTGVAGSGKSSIASELASLSYNVLDDKTAPDGMGLWFSKDGSILGHSIYDMIKARASGGSWGWDEAKLQDFLATRSTANIVCGHWSGMDEYLPKFDSIIYLHATPQTINDRLGKRPFGYGFYPSERKKVLADISKLEQKLQKYNPIKINANQPLAEVVKDVDAAIQLVL